METVRNSFALISKNGFDKHRASRQTIRSVQLVSFEVNLKSQTIPWSPAPHKKKGKRFLVVKIFISSKIPIIIFHIRKSPHGLCRVKMIEGKRYFFPETHKKKRYPSYRSWELVVPPPHICGGGGKL